MRPDGRAAPAAGAAGEPKAGRGEPAEPGAVLWTPSRERALRTRLTAFAHRARERGADSVIRADGLPDYAALHRWSVNHPTAFWALVWEFCDVIADPPMPSDAGATEAGRGLTRMAPPDPEHGPCWFPDARLNFAENLLRYRDDRIALVSWNELGRSRTLTYAQLAAEVGRLAAALRHAGIRPGDRVAGFLPNIPEAVIAALAAAAVGATWSSCSPDFGVSAVVDRFGQIGPRVLFGADGFRYNGKVIDCRPRIREIASRIPSIESVVVAPCLARLGAPADDRVTTGPGADGLEPAQVGVLWDHFVRDEPDLRFERLPFDHPLYIVYTSGTTGLPKAIVHGAGGTLLQHLKELALHVNLQRNDRIFYFTTCGWMMWNWLLSSLAIGATVVLYDGSPMAPGPASSPGADTLPTDAPAQASPAILWDMAAAERITVFGTSARYLALIEKAGLQPGRTHDLGALRAVLSTGSPLAAGGFDYVYSNVKADVHLASISGGTDILSCFVLGDPTRPVRRGEIQVPGLGMAVEVWDERATRVLGEPGELVCTRPFPSMPVAFWDDRDGSRYREAYFERFPNVWTHGDWTEQTAQGGFIIHGRSDATLNPGGVRIGTAEIYRQVETLDEVVECLAVAHEIGGAAAGDVRVVLFVRLRNGLSLDDAMRDRIRRRVRDQVSPHHVPRLIIQVPDLPRTLSGKISETAVRETIHGRPVPNADALANPACLDLFRNLVSGPGFTLYF